MILHKTFYAEVHNLVIKLSIVIKMFPTIVIIQTGISSKFIIKNFSVLYGLSLGFMFRLRFFGKFYLSEQVVSNISTDTHD